MVKHTKTKWFSLFLVKFALWTLSEFIISPLILFVGLTILFNIYTLLPFTGLLQNITTILWILFSGILFFLAFGLPFFIFFPDKAVKVVKKRRAKRKARKRRSKSTKHKRGKK